MKAHSLTFYSIAMALAVGYFSGHAFTSSPTRAPASAEDDLKNSLCLSKQNEAKLEAQLKKELKDKEDVLKELDSLKKEIKEVKEIKKAAKVEAPTAPAQSVDIVTLMSQITSLLQSQQQQQSQFMLQMQMMNMFSQNQYDLTPPSMMNYSLSNPMGGYGIGLSSNYQMWGQNPYAQLPQSPMSRTQIPQNNGFNFVLDNRTQIPPNSGFNMGFMPLPANSPGFDFSTAPVIPEQKAPVVSLVQTTET